MKPIPKFKQATNNKGCYNCKFFLYEDFDGYGICALYDDESHCSVLCEKWEQIISEN